MYVAEIDGQELTFEASGKLWQDALVMADDQTMSLWSQVSGECISGEYLGRKLTLYPSAFSTFKEARGSENIVFLAKPEKGEAESNYEEYFQDRERMGIFGTVYNDSLLEGKDLILGLRDENMQVAVPIKSVDDRPAVLVPFGNDRILLISDGRKVISAYHLPFVNGISPKLETDGSRVVISGLGEDSIEIVFKDGKHIEGQKLESFPVITAYWFAWKAFFPASELFQP